MIRSLLIANRGEIACRIIRTARAMGIRTVAVYSDADARALHARTSDEAVHIGASPARESYLVGAKIIAAAKATGAEAIHPGYGFLSENAAFAQGVIDAGLIWVGPRPASITAMGLKDAAKTLMAAAGVPVTPGYMGANQDPAFLASQAAEIGYPVLIKAVAGGGGKGMRKVENATDFADALASCQREATASFGNAHVLIEKYIQRPRHIEVQVFGDTHGNIVHLFERDCSLQRRHQKVIEEAPAPGMDEATREQLCAVAVRAAKAVDYVGAGTIEFIADASEGLRADRIWFMEMNTRLQVEHPVTEEITGVDLVEWQLRVASGEPLPKRQDELHITGWAVEARLYAENPAKGFLPSVGKLEVMTLPESKQFASNPLDWPTNPDPSARPRHPRAWLRIDRGVERGDDVSPFYDPMIAKIIVWQPTRLEALIRISEMLSRIEIFPVHTNAGFLNRLANFPAVRAGDVSTALIAGAPDIALKPELPFDMATHVSAFVRNETIRSLWRCGGSLGGSGFRLNVRASPKTTIYVDGVGRIVPQKPQDDWRAPPAERVDDAWRVFSGGEVYEVGLEYRPLTTGITGTGTILSPMPGRIIAVEVAAGDPVIKGQKLVTLEAMKMEHSLTAPFDGVVAESRAEVGAQVQVDALLVRVDPLPPST